MLNVLSTLWFYFLIQLVKIDAPAKSLLQAVLEF